MEADMEENFLRRDGPRPGPVHCHFYQHPLPLSLSLSQLFKGRVDHASCALIFLKPLQIPNHGDSSNEAPRLPISLGMKCFQPWSMRPTVSRREDFALNLLVAGVAASVPVREENPRPQLQSAVELQPATGFSGSLESAEDQRSSSEDLNSNNVDLEHRNSRQTEDGLTGTPSTEFERLDEETSPLVSHASMDAENERSQMEDGMTESSMSQGIKLGLGDFVFYSVLVGRAAMYDLMTVYA